MDDRRLESTSEQAVLIAGSPSPRSRSRTLLDHAAAQLDAAGFATTVVDLGTLPADALLGRRPDEGVAAALSKSQAARILVASSPIYRATYSGLLKVFFDQFPADALRGVIAIPIMTGGSPAHALAVDHGLRPLFASLGATVVSTGAYGHDKQFATAPGIAATAAEGGVPAGRSRDPGAVSHELLEQVERAVDEAIELVRASSPAVRS